VPGVQVPEIRESRPVRDRLGLVSLTRQSREDRFASLWGRADNPASKGKSRECAGRGMMERRSVGVVEAWMGVEKLIWGMYT
jgi:hypothetical protein